MINRTLVYRVGEDLLCAGIMLTVCSVILLGPQPSHANTPNQQPDSTADHLSEAVCDSQGRLQSTLHSSLERKQ